MASGYTCVHARIHPHTCLHTCLHPFTHALTHAGSFIGFSSAFPKLIQDVFGYLPDGKTPDPAAPNPKRLAWLGPALSSGFRPLGGWLGDRYGGAQVTHATALA